MEDERDNFKQAMRFAVETYGTELLNDVRRVNALLMDYVPHQAKERKLIVSALQEGVGSNLIKALGKEKQEQQLCMNRCIRCLIDEAWVTEEAAQFAVAVISFSIGINIAETPKVVKSDPIPALTSNDSLTNSALHYIRTDNENNLTWELEKGTLTIRGKGNMVDYTDKDKTPWSSQREDIQAVVIESGVTSIGKYAFYNCISLTSVTIPGSVISINSGAFHCTGLTTITIPNSVAYIGNGAFSWCSSLQEILVDENNVNYTSEDGILFSKDKIMIIGYPSGKEKTAYAVPNSVASIAGSSFSGCASLTTVTIPDGVTSIGSFAFCDCYGLATITIPNSVSFIGEYAFFNCTSLTTVTIPDGVTSIEEGAFGGCTSLAALTIPGSVKSIGKGAFYNCSDLTAITIPSVTTIGVGAFYGCTALTAFTISNGVTTIEKNAFRCCAGLKDVYYSGTRSDYNRMRIDDGNASLTNAMWHYMGADNGGQLTWTLDRGTLTIHGKGEMEDYTTKDRAPWYNQQGKIQEVVIESGVTSIGRGAFFFCSSLTSVTIPDSVTSIGGWAFFQCFGLATITIPDGVVSIGMKAFFGCTGLTMVIIPDSVTSIEGGAFQDCSSLKAVLVSDSVKLIGDDAFWGCSDDLTVCCRKDSYVERYCCAHKITCIAV